jgi:GNAT superfamily N-acetyltransferase
MSPPIIRPAEAGDLPGVVSLVRALADFEKLPGPDDEAAARLAQHFAERRFRLLVADHEGKLVGYALYFFNYSTFLARPSLYLEDLFVLPESRGLGVGRQFMEAMARVAEEESCGRFEWCVLEWNVRAQDFYRSLGAELLDTWRVCRLTAPAITALASSTAS